MLEHNRGELIRAYLNRLGKVSAFPGEVERSAEIPTALDLSDAANEDRIQFATSELDRIIRDHLGDSPHLHEIARLLVASGDRALRLLSGGEESEIAEDWVLRAGLEAIVLTDGSRPSFMVRNGEVDRSTSPIGTWGSTLDASGDGIAQALECVGRIDVPEATQGFAGTGFLIGENLILTNRHVLQAIATRDAAGSWTFMNGAKIDFGHEFRARTSINPRSFNRVLFCGSQPIDVNGPVDHAKLDLALIELDSADPAQLPRNILGLDIAPDWAPPDLVMFTIGYPGTPPFGPYAPTLLEQLFQSTFGCKRLAPGLVTKPLASVHTWTMAHDATTLGGNSGSVILVAGREGVCAGLHYGGQRGNAGENWGHMLGRVLDETDGSSSKTLREHMTRYGLKLVDRHGS